MTLAAAPVFIDTTRGRRRPHRSRRRILWRGVALLAVLLLLPVPWQHKSDSRVGLAWGMDNRLLVDGERLNPPGRYSWLTAGRPAVLGELAWQRVTALFDQDAQPISRDLRVGDAWLRPMRAEPVAAAAGLTAAGRGITRAEDVDAVIGGHGPPYSWFRSLSLGPSHGLMVGLVTYAAVTREDLAAGRHIAGTGQLNLDGSVVPVGGLLAKALGARRAGADVLVVPAAQRHELDGLNLGGMHVLGVTSLDDAIIQLRATRPA